VRAGFVLIFFLSVPCFAQRYIKIGLSVPQTTATAPYGAIEQALPGFLGGIAFSRQWSEKIAIRPEILFIQKGFRFTSSTEQLRIRLNYIEFPLMGVLTLSRQERPVMIFLEAGPSIGYGLGGKYELRSTQPRSGAVKFGEPPATPSQDLYFENPIDIGFQIGFAFSVTKKWLVEMRYGHGFMSVDEPPNPLPSGTKSSDFIMKNRVLQFSLGMALGKQDH
jgi:hypothetical protein